MWTNRIGQILQQSPFDDGVGAGDKGKDDAQGFADDIGAEHTRKEYEGEMANRFVAQHEGLGVLGYFVAEKTENPAVNSRANVDQCHREKVFALVEDQTDRYDKEQLFKAIGKGAAAKVGH